MKDSYIKSDPETASELHSADEKASVISALLEDTIEPLFHGYNSKGIVDFYAEDTEGDRDKAAAKWIEENYDALYSALYACRVLAADLRDTLQMLPVPKTED